MVRVRLTTILTISRSRDLASHAMSLFTEELTRWLWLESDEARVFYRRLAMFDRFAINGIADHLHERIDAWVLGNEDAVPALRRRADQHVFEAADPMLFAAQASKDRSAIARIGAISFFAGCIAAVGVRRFRSKPNEIQHVNRAGPLHLAKYGELFFRRIDVVGQDLLPRFIRGNP